MIPLKLKILKFSTLKDLASILSLKKEKYLPKPNAEYAWYSRCDFLSSLIL